MIILRRLKIAILLLSLIIISFSNVVLSNAIGFDKKIHKNVYVRNIDLSNLSKEEAIKKINKVIEDNDCFYLNLNDKKYSFSKNGIDVDYHVEDLAEEAYQVGRNNGFISNMRTKVDLNSGHKTILDYTFSYNEEKMNDYLNFVSQEIYTKPVNSSIKINRGNIVVSKEKYGYKLNKNKLKSIILSKVENIDNKDEEIPVITIKPYYLYDQLIKVNTVLGSFETYFNPKNENRSNNISLASNATSCILLEKGQVFSFNNSIKKSCINKDLKEAPIIVNGKQEKGIGGGMCQVSSTIYNAALYAGMNIINVKNHSIPSPYIEKGRDATVSQGFIDLKFSNNFNTPIYIYNEISGNKITSTIYGNQQNKLDIEVITKVKDVIHNRIVRKNSEDYDLGDKVIVQEGRKGYKVETYRVYKDNHLGNKIEYISESYYPAQDKIIIYGTREERK